MNMITINEACWLLGVDRSAIKTFRLPAEHLPEWRPGHAVCIPRGAVDEIVKRLATGGTAPSGAECQLSQVRLRHSLNRIVTLIVSGRLTGYASNTGELRFFRQDLDQLAVSP